MFEESYQITSELMNFTMLCNTYAFRTSQNMFVETKSVFRISIPVLKLHKKGNYVQKVKVKFLKIESKFQI